MHNKTVNSMDRHFKIIVTERGLQQLSQSVALSEICSSKLTQLKCLRAKVIVAFNCLENKQLHV